jgi:hypothetical protein
VLGSALGDLLWSYLVASGSHEVGSPADLPYVLTAVAIAWAAWAPKTDPLARSDDDRLALLLPAVAASCALGLLFYGAITGDLIVPSLALALAALSAGVIRWLLAVRREAQAVALRDVAAELARKAEQQAAVADLGSRAAATSDPERVMGLAAEAVAEILQAERVAVLELAPGGIELTVRADSVAHTEAGDLQQLGHAALAAEAPTVVSGAGLCARIEGKDGPWGVLALAHPRARELGDDDVSFVRAVANVLGAVVARAREEQRGPAPAVAPARERRQAGGRRRPRLQQPARDHPGLRGLRARGGDRRRAAARPRGALEGGRTRRGIGQPAAGLQPPASGRRDRARRGRAGPRHGADAAPDGRRGRRAALLAPERAAGHHDGREPAHAGAAQPHAERA